MPLTRSRFMNAVSCTRFHFMLYTRPTPFYPPALTSLCIFTSTSNIFFSTTRPLLLSPRLLTTTTSTTTDTTAINIPHLLSPPLPHINNIASLSATTATTITITTTTTTILQEVMRTMFTFMFYSWWKDGSHEDFSESLWSFLGVAWGNIQLRYCNFALFTSQARFLPILIKHPRRWNTLWVVS